MISPDQHIIDLINEGEHQQLDFKFEISDSKKIARTLAAFSNTDGGTLLIGVKDNGAIAGVRSEEEFYMIEAAAQLYCKPSVEFTSKEWHINGKAILEVMIPKSDKKPHSAPDKTGKYMVYVRVEDQNLLANSILLKVWKQEKQSKGVYIKFTTKEKILLEYLENNPQITFSQFKKLARISHRAAENILVKLISIDVIEIVIEESGSFYRLKNN